MPRRLAELEKAIGHTFKDISLLERAVTHKSWAFENLPDATPDTVRDSVNEVLEFLGDSVLGLAIAEALFRKKSDMSEGELTLMKHHLVSTATLAQLAEELKLGDYLRIGRGEEKSGGRKKQALLADLFEAVVGAVFLDAGYIPARNVITRIFADELENASPASAIDYKSLLQETLQGSGLEAPNYRIVSTEGPPHDRTFHVAASWEGGKATGTGSSIKAAEMMAAEEALNQINADGNDPSA